MQVGEHDLCLALRATKISVKNQIWTALIICPCGCNAMWKIKCAQWVCTQTAREPSNYRELCLLSTLVFRSWCITWKNARLWILWKSNTSHSALERAQHLPKYNGEAPHKPSDTYHSGVEPPPVQDITLHDINYSKSSLLVSKHPDLFKLFTFFSICLWSKEMLQKLFHLNIKSNIDHIHLEVLEACWKTCTTYSRQ